MKKIIFVLAMTLVPLSSFGLAEFTFGYQGIVSSSSGGNWLGPGISMSGAYGYTVEGRFEIPVTSWAFGMRYGKYGLSGGGGGATMTLDSTQTSLIAAYRFINTGVLFGMVASYGLSNSGSLQHSAASLASASAGSGSSYSVGLEFGLKLPFVLAMEVGYGSLNLSGFSTQTLSGSPTSVELTGAYSRIFTGFNF